MGLPQEVTDETSEVAWSAGSRAWDSGKGRD
ncbi:MULTISPECIES: RHS domain-containing protein [Paraburkholderia]|nr:hypothetical protein C9I56_34495 [Paraburkholderia caribensis]